MAALSPTASNPHRPHASDFRYRTANYYAVQSLDSLVIRGVIASWSYEPADNLFCIRTHSQHGGPLMYTAKQVETFEVGAIAVLNAVINNGLTVDEVHRGVAGLKPKEEPRG